MVCRPRAPRVDGPVGAPLSTLRARRRREVYLPALAPRRPWVLRAPGEASRRLGHHRGASEYTCGVYPPGFGCPLLGGVLLFRAWPGGTPPFLARPGGTRAGGAAFRASVRPAAEAGVR
jgi:hypothetical protein